MISRISSSLVLLILLVSNTVSIPAADPIAPFSEIEVGPEDWAWWRGPTRDGIAPGDQDPPTVWSESENVLWRVPVAGRGHGSATVVGDQVFLTTADSEQQTVLCVDRQTGRTLWDTTIHKGGLPKSGTRKAGNSKASFASTTPACDGKLVFVNFYNDGAVYTTALNRDGRQVWQTQISPYVIHQGYGSSPCLYKDLVIVSADNKGGGAIKAMKRTTGDIVWERKRPPKPNYPSPIILKIEGQDQLLFTGCDLVTSLNPQTGDVLWETEGSTTECVTSTVTDGKHIFTSGGYPKNHISAVTADGSKKKVWENNVRTYVPSMIVNDGHLFAVLDAGIASCRNCETGKEIWKCRLAGTFSSSPVLVGDLLYATNEDGTTFVLKVSPDGYEKLAINKLGSNVFATPTICGGRIYLRVAHENNGERQEYLYCLGRK